MGEAEPMMDDDDTLPFTGETLDQLYAEVSGPQGVTVARLGALIDAFGTRDRALEDTQSYREGRKPWKKLRDEIVPVEHFLSLTYPADARVRFSLDDQPPDAWLSVGDGSVKNHEVIKMRDECIVQCDTDRHVGPMRNMGARSGSISQDLTSKGLSANTRKRVHIG